MVDVVLATGQVMPHGPAAEDALLVEALGRRGVAAVIQPWGSDVGSDVRLVVVRTTWDYTEHLPEFLAWVRRTADTTTVLNPAEVISWNSHKSYLLDLAAAGVPAVPTTLVPIRAAAPARRQALDRQVDEIVIKPAVGVGADRTMRVAAGSPEAAEQLRALTLTGDALVQPFQPTVLTGEVSLMYFGGVYSHAVRKIPAAGDYRVQVFHGGVVEPHQATSAERDTATAAFSVVPHPLAYARVDLVETDQGAALMELELIEPQLFLDQPGGAAGRFAAVIASRLLG